MVHTYALWFDPRSVLSLMPDGIVHGTVLCRAWEVRGHVAAAAGLRLAV